MTVAAPWVWAWIRAGLMVGAAAGRPIRVDGPAMDPFMAALVHWVRRMPEPGGPPGAMRPQYEKAAKLTGLRPDRRVAVQDISVPGGAGERPARLYRPPNPIGTMVYLHGGGFVMGSLETHDNLCRTLAMRTGLVVLAVDYRLAPEHTYPAASDDAEAALIWAAANPPVPGPLVIGGDSAGGQLALIAMAAHPEIELAAHFLMYPVVDMLGGYASEALFGEGYLLTVRAMGALAQAYIPPGMQRSDPRLSPLHAEGGIRPVPAVVVAAGFDPIRDQARAYADRLCGLGTPVRFIEEQRLIHGFADFAGVVPEARRAVWRAADALRALLVQGSRA